MNGGRRQSSGFHLKWLKNIRKITSGSRQQGQYSNLVLSGNRTYLLKAITAEIEKWLLLGNGPYTRTRWTRHVRCEVTQQWKICCKQRSLWVRAALVGTQLCPKHISAAVNKQATIDLAVFSMGLTQLELALSREFRFAKIREKSQLQQRIKRVGSWQNNWEKWQERN
jgi:hypothetical protein